MAGSSGPSQVGEDEPELVAVAAQVRARDRAPRDFDAAFARATVYARRATDRVAVMVSDLGEKGRWVLAFSTPDRLAAHAGDVPWLSTTGADLLDQLPAGLGVLFDIGAGHGLPLLPQPAGRARFADPSLPNARKSG